MFMRSKFIGSVIYFCLFLLILGCEQKPNEDSIFENEEIKLNYKNSELEYNFSRLFALRLVEVNRKNDFSRVHNFQQNAPFDPYFWIANAETQTLEKYNLNFELQSSIGSKGFGPSEFSQAHVFYTDKNKILVHDFQQTAIKQVNLLQNEISHFKLKTYFYSLAFFSNSQVLIKYSDNEGFTDVLEFELVDFKEGDVANTIKIPIERTQYVSKVYEGDFRLNDSFGIYFNYCVGRLFVFDRKEKKFLRAITTIDKTPPPRAEYKSFGGGMKVLVNVPSYQMFVDGFLDQNDYFWLLNDISNEKETKVIDVYSVTETRGNEYQFSIKVPNLTDGQEAVKIFKVGENLLVFYEDLTIVNYEILE